MRVARRIGLLGEIIIFLSPKREIPEVASLVPSRPAENVEKVSAT